MAAIGPARTGFPTLGGKVPSYSIIIQRITLSKVMAAIMAAPSAVPAGCRLPTANSKPRSMAAQNTKSMSCFTAYVMNTDADAAVNSTYLCNEYGIDTISAGGVIAFAMECAEKGMFTKEQLQGLDLSWGNAAVLPVMVKMISLREGIGDILAEGVRIAAQKIGQGSEEFAIHVKGLEGPAARSTLGQSAGCGLCDWQPGYVPYPPAGRHGLGPR